MKTSKIICALISLFSCLTLTKNVFSNAIENTSPQVPSSSLECRKDASNAKYKVIENNNKTRTITYSSKLIDYYDGYDLDDEQYNYLTNKTITYNATCYYEIGLFTFDNIISDDFQEDSDFKFTFYGFTKKINNHNDVLLHFGITTMLASDVIATDEEDPLCFSPIHLPGGIVVMNGVHYIYISSYDFRDHGFATTYSAHNCNNVGPYAPNLISSFFSSGTNFGVDQQFIWGFIIHD